MERNNLIFRIYDKIKHDKIFIYSSHASFYILISAIPFITFSISLIKEFLIISEQEISNVLLPFFPIATQHAAENIIYEIFEKTSGGFISFSVISLLWTASRGISAIKRGLRSIYNLQPLNFFKDILTSILLMLFLISVIIILIFVAVFSSAITSGFIIFLIGFSLFVLLFSLIYYLFTARKFPLHAHLPGGISASMFWLIFIRTFSVYIEHFANYSYIYGSLTAVFLIALWIYFSTIIFFLGAELNIVIFSGYFKKESNKKKNCN